MPNKRKVKKEDFALLQDLHLKIHHLKMALDPNKNIPMFSTDFSASGIIGLVLGKDFEVEIDVDVRVFFNKLNDKVKKKLATEHKKLASQMNMRIIDYDTAIPELILPEMGPEEVAEVYEDEDGNACDADGNLLE